MSGMGIRKRRNLSVSEFKAKVLRLVDEAQATGIEYVITKRGKPVVLVTPIVPETRSYWGAWQGSEAGDIVHSDWSGEFSAARSAKR
jgi:prevent-host-death family protein